MTDQLAADGGLVLRQWRESDAAAVLLAFSAPEMSRQATRAVEDQADATRWVQDRLRDWNAGTGFSWAVLDHRAEVVGCAAVTAVDHRHGSGWVSYWTTAEARGLGVASAGTLAVARWAFADLGLFRLELGHRTNNPASCRVARRAGFLVEGLERAKLSYDGVRYDVELHARLATDPEPG